MNTIKTLILATALAGAAASTQATEISGSIGFSGDYTTDTGNVNTANTFYFSGAGYTGNDPAHVSGLHTGAYATVPTGTLGGWTSLTINPVTPANPLWSFTVSGVTYSFNLLAFTVTQPGDDTVTVKGTGLASVTGLDSTAGTFVFTANQAGENFTFSASQKVPDGGATAILLGVGMLGLGAMRRKS